MDLSTIATGLASSRLVPRALTFPVLLRDRVVTVVTAVDLSTLGCCSSTTRTTSTVAPKSFCRTASATN